MEEQEGQTEWGWPSSKCGAGAGMVSSGAGMAGRNNDLVVFQDAAPVLEGGQPRVWPSSRNPRRCLKGAKRANVFVTLVTDVTLWTRCWRSLRGRDAAVGLGR